MCIKLYIIKMATKETRPRRKAGRTLLVSNEHKEELSLDGLVNTHTTSSGSRFLVFDNVENARSAYKKLRDDGVRTKYSYYKIFFRLKDVNLENVEYDELKNSVKELATSCGNVDVLYFKFYTKNKTLMGSGDLTVDTKEGLDALVSQKEMKFGEGSASFYRFKLKSKDDDGQDAQEANA